MAESTELLHHDSDVRTEDESDGGTMEAQEVVDAPDNKTTPPSLPQTPSRKRSLKRRSKASVDNSARTSLSTCVQGPKKGEGQIVHCASVLEWKPSDEIIQFGPSDGVIQAEPVEVSHEDIRLPDQIAGSLKSSNMGDKTLDGFVSQLDTVLDDAVHLIRSRLRSFLCGDDELLTELNKRRPPNNSRQFCESKALLTDPLCHLTNVDGYEVPSSGAKGETLGDIQARIRKIRLTPIECENQKACPPKDIEDDGEVSQTIRWDLRRGNCSTFESDGSRANLGELAQAASRALDGPSTQARRSMRVRQSVLSFPNVFAVERTFTGTESQMEDKEEQHFLKEKERTAQGKLMFADAAQMKDKVKQALAEKPYDVRDFYKDEGKFQKVARSDIFERVTLALIALNSVWIAVDTDNNDSDVLIKADPIFIIVENCFCTYFAAEWLIRFMAFKNKINCFKDGSFIFDTGLCMFMVMETWVMSAFILLFGSGTFGAGNASLLRLVKLLRLTRMARMARLLRAIEELMVLVKAILVAFRSVFFTGVLLMGIIYVFAIMFVQITIDSEVGKQYFDGVLPAMGSLLLHGILPDQGSFVYDVSGVNFFWGILVMIFIFIASLTVMGMLAGILVQVVSAVSSVEKEKMVVDFVKEEMRTFLEEVDQERDNCLTKQEFKNLLANQSAVRTLAHVGVDVVGLADLMEFLFEDKETITFQKFMELVLQLRGNNTATVKDIVDMRRFMSERIVNKMGTIIKEQLQAELSELEDSIKTILQEENKRRNRSQSSSVARERGPSYKASVMLRRKVSHDEDNIYNID